MRPHPIFPSDLGLPILTGIAVAIALMWSQPLLHAANSPVTIGGPFTLTAPDRTTVTEQTYRGKWLLVYFGFTSCPHTCPAALLEIAGALEKLGPDADKLQPLFITVDPLRDAPAVMGKYTLSHLIRGSSGSRARRSRSLPSPRHMASTTHLIGPGRARKTTSWTTAPTST